MRLYGPHDPTAAPATVMVVGAGPWAHEYAVETPRELLEQRAQINTAASAPMSLTRCCEGSTYVLPNDLDGLSWAVCCIDCDRCLAVVEGPREEVYADL